MVEESATPDLVEMTRDTFEAVNRGDLDAVMKCFAPDAVWEAVSLGTSFEGVAAIRGFCEDWLGPYEDYELRPDEILDLGGGVVFVVTRFTARSAGSAAGEMTRSRPLVFTWVEGLVARVTAHPDSIDEARAAAERLAEERG
jgi:ketosteroid isomerase-like protein